MVAGKMTKPLAVLLVLILTIMAGCAPGGNNENNNNGSVNNSMNNNASDNGKTDTGDEVVELTMSVIPGPVASRFQADAEAFMNENPNIKIKLNEFPEGQYMDQGPRLFSSSEKPDLAWFWADAAYHNMANEGLLAPLDDLYESEDWHDALPSSTIERVRAEDGSLYAVNTAIVWGPVVYYNKKAFEEAGVEVPETMEDWYAAGPKLKEAGYIPLVAGNSDVGILTISGLIVNNFAEEDYSKLLNGEIDYTDERIVDAFAQLKKMGDELMQTGAAGVTDPDARALFTQGRAAMYSNGSWAASDALLGKELPEGFELGNFYYPQAQEDVPAKVAIYPGNALIVMEGTGKEEAAKKFIAFAMSQERHKEVAKGGEMFPSRTDLTNEDIHPMGDIYVGLYEKMNASPTANFWHTEVSAELSTKGRDLVPAVLSGAKTPEEAAAELQAIAEEE